MKEQTVTYQYIYVSVTMANVCNFVFAEVPNTLENGFLNYLQEKDCFGKVTVECSHVRVKVAHKIVGVVLYELLLSTSTRAVSAWEVGRGFYVRVH